MRARGPKSPADLHPSDRARVDAIKTSMRKTMGLRETPKKDMPREIADPAENARWHRASKKIRAQRAAELERAKAKGKGKASTALAKRPSASVAIADVKEDLAHAASLAETSHAANTRRAYRADIADWQAYAAKAGTPTVPADPVAIVAYIANMDHKRKLKRSTIRRRCAAIAFLHREKKLPNPMLDLNVQKVLRGVSRTLTDEQTKKYPLTPEMMSVLLDSANGGHSRTAVRDRALLMLGIVMGVRRSELVAIRWSDVTYHDEGLIVTIRRSKTDQQARGRKVSVPRHEDPEVCPVRALERWKQASADKGRVFPISAQTVADRVKRLALVAGLDPALFSGHSIRAGLMTIAADEDVSLDLSMGQSGHRNRENASGYVRKKAAFSNPTPFAVLNAIARARRGGDA